MSVLELSLDCGPYDRTAALRTGEVRAAGIELIYAVPDEERQVFARMVRNGAFDIAEMALSYFLIRAVQEGPAALPFVALPVFPSRAFRHGFVFVNRRAGIRHPKDLEGRRVGCTEFRNTASVWIRGLLQERYDVDLDTVRWFEGGVNRPVPPSMRLDVAVARPTPSTHLPAGVTLDAMLAAGELDAVISPRVPASLGGGLVARLFPDAAAVEREHVDAGGVFPMMHVVVLRRSLHEAHPWVAESLFDAFDRAKAHAWEQLRASSTGPVTMLPWQDAAVAEVDERFGSDPWAYGLEPNRRALETFLRHLTQQGFTERVVDPASLFVPVVERGGEVPSGALGPSAR